MRVVHIRRRSRRCVTSEPEITEGSQEGTGKKATLLSVTCQRLANFTCTEPNSQYLGICRPFSGSDRSWNCRPHSLQLEARNDSQAPSTSLFRRPQQTGFFFFFFWAYRLRPPPVKPSACSFQTGTMLSPQQTGECFSLHPGCKERKLKNSFNMDYLRVEKLWEMCIFLFLLICIVWMFYNRNIYLKILPLLKDCIEHEVNICNNVNETNFLPKNYILKRKV